jgi:hypothetical protein
MTEPVLSYERGRAGENMERAHELVVGEGDITPKCLQALDEAENRGAGAPEDGPPL